MSGYLHALEWTGNAAVDGILDAVADAGDRYHHTEYWGEDAYGDGSPIAKISAAAAKAADEWQGNRDARNIAVGLAMVACWTAAQSQSDGALLGDDLMRAAGIWTDREVST